MSEGKREREFNQAQRMKGIAAQINAAEKTEVKVCARERREGLMIKGLSQIKDQTETAGLLY